MLDIYLQNDSDSQDIPSEVNFHDWLNAATQIVPPPKPSQNHINICIINTAAMSELNQTYRQKQGPTNVLSFPDEPIPGEAPDSLGDIAICADVVQQEAHAQNIPETAHWAHLVIHGYLHLLGYDHMHDKEAGEMEALEVKILNKLGFANPYEV